MIQTSFVVSVKGYFFYPFGTIFVAGFTNLGFFVNILTNLKFILLENTFFIISKLEKYFSFWVYSISIDSMVTASKAEMKNLSSKEGFWNLLLWGAKQSNKI